MKIDPVTINKIALSHGHEDHTTAVTEVIRAMDLRPKSKKWEQAATVEEIRRYAEGRRVPVIAHPKIEPSAGQCSHRRAPGRKRWAQRSFFPKGHINLAQAAGQPALFRA